MDPLSEILEAAGIPQDRPTRTVAVRDGHRVVTEQAPVDVSHWVSHSVVAEFDFNFANDLLSASGLSLEQWQREWINSWTTVKPRRFTDITSY